MPALPGTWRILTEPLELLTPHHPAPAPGPGSGRGPGGGGGGSWTGSPRALRELARRYDFFVVEGAGGLYVPLIDTEFLVLDLIRWLRLPLLVVARAGLGTINHTALTVMAARQAGIEVAGMILNRYPQSPQPGGADQSRGD